MSTFINNIDNTFTDTENQPVFSESVMDKMISEIKELIILKKLSKFQLVDYTNSPPPCPVLKMTINTGEINSAMKNIEPGKLVLAKGKSSSKVMLYMDDDSIVWEVAANSNNVIIDVEYCSPANFPRKVNNDNKISAYLKNIAESMHPDDKEIIYPNVFNLPESLEYEIIVGKILKGMVTQDKTFDQFVEYQVILETINVLQKLEPWKVINIRSTQPNFHVFMCKDYNNKIWLVVTDYNLRKVTDLFVLPNIELN